jgi:hypothetical protein
MKEIRLIDLNLDNFQGGNFSLTLDGDDADVFAQNGMGKTRLFSGYTWITTGLDSLGRPTFEIKNIHPEDGTYDPEAAVQATLSVDGQRVVLKKIMREKWASVRGKADKRMSGNEKLYSINGVTKIETEYRELLREILCDEETLSLITNPTAFSSIPDKKGVPGWQRQRSILLDIVGDVSAEQVIESDSALAPLTGLLTNFTVSKNPVDDLKKVAKSGRLSADKAKELIPVRIDEQRRMMPDVTGLDRKAIIKNVGVLESAVNDAKLRLSGIDNGAGIAELSKQLQELKYEINTLENQYYLEGMRHVTQMNARINELTSGKQDKDPRINNVKATLAANQTKITGLERQLQTMREKWTAIDAETFQDVTESVCAACGQALPTDRVQEARDKALAHFNQDKAERLLAVETKGKELRGELDRMIPDVERLHALLMELQAVGEDDQYSMLVAERDILKARAEDYSQIPNRAEMLEQKAALEKQIEEIRAGISGNTEVIHKEIVSLEAQLTDAKERADRFTKREQGMARIEELKAEEKKLSKQIEDEERIIYLCNLFIEKKVAMLDSRIQARFKYVQFRLFKKNITNDGVDECCDVLVNGVPYNAGLNSGARIMAGLEICDVLQEHYGIRAPVFVDDAEKFTSPVEMNCQVIRLVASKGDERLRVEKTSKNKRVAA